ncbi:SapC family protein [Sandaracinobacter sp. RS1-74]|uniref:SapC family protein n=1 Tax=Sandaracinobacteroides sayramensis TaxID=2913411 RepID=UPI001EDA9838|nr:SapC family protein [Sandaracinobacteroides sayramensis]MCG2839879.1 SapC family protein [Sandaracinobacteroides sayramensis]
MAETAELTPAAPLLPLYYRLPQLLHGDVHAGWRLKDSDASFAAETPFVPIVASELAEAARSYPVVFAADSGQRIAVLDLERVNLFLEDGRWAAGHHVPAYVRRYPFTFVQIYGRDGVSLAIDAGSQRVAQAGDEGHCAVQGWRALGAHAGGAGVSGATMS